MDELIAQLDEAIRLASTRAEHLRLTRIRATAETIRAQHAVDPGQLELPLTA